MQAPIEPTLWYRKLKSNCELKLILLNEVENSKALSISQAYDPQVGPNSIKPKMDSK